MIPKHVEKFSKSTITASQQAFVIYFRYHFLTTLLTWVRKIKVIANFQSSSQNERFQIIWLSLYWICIEDYSLYSCSYTYYISKHPQFSNHWNKKRNLKNILRSVLFRYEMIPKKRWNLGWNTLNILCSRIACF